MKDIADELSEHPFFEGLAPETLSLIAGCGVNAVYKPEELLAREGSSADELFVIRKGRVALLMHSTERGALQVDTRDAGDVVGLSFLVPPYRWPVEARAVQTVHVIRMDGKCLRDKCNADTALGYELMQRVATALMGHLNARSIQLLDLYGQLEL
ncbi:MAG: cyclic nucleotide-binding domain-containing protein [Halieaceae bacterium]|nr:cyclic nucleotide-binding domain-containing protein [Halieaceae bacterium]